MSDSRIAVIGMACRVPAAPDVGRFWQLLRDGVEGIRRFTPAELTAAGVEESVSRGRNYVPVCGALEGIEQFDADFFGVPRREAEIMDPQHRVFLELAWEALEDAGYAGPRDPGRTGVYAGSGLSTYLLYHLLPSPDLARFASPLQVLIANNKDSMCARASYRLNFRGPSLNVSTACSTSLVAVHVACQALLNQECDVALAGGIGIQLPQDRGYVYEPEGILSPDGHCRAFDASAAGTVAGNGGGIVVLKRCEDAEADRDAVRAVILGTAINNDGALKAGFTAPSMAGQIEVVEEALELAGVSPDTIGYVETHGTGTPVGDPIELNALTEVFRRRSSRRQFCAIGSVKTNIGHLDEGAGVAGLIKTVLALEHRQIPPSLNFTRPNPHTDLESGPFFVSTALREWTSGDAPRRAGVSSFGIGGTNAHVVLEEAPDATPRPVDWPRTLLTLSARSPEGLQALAGNLGAHLEASPLLDLADVAFTLQTGRRAFPYRHAVICGDRADAVTRLARLSVGEVAIAGAAAPSEQDRCADQVGRILREIQAERCREDRFAPHRMATWEQLLGSIAALWESGARVDWERLYESDPRRRVSLPTTPFQRRRYWIDPPSPRQAPPKRAAAAGVEKWLYTPGWTAAPRTSAAGSPTGQTLVFVSKDVDERSPWLRNLIDALAGRCADLITVTPGERYHRLGPRHYEVRPNELADFEALVADLSRSEAGVRTFAHLWQLTGRTALDDETLMTCGFESVLCLARVVGGLAGAGVRLAVVTDAGHAVDPDDPVRAEKSAMSGLVRAVAVEYPSVTCTHLDLDAAGPGGNDEVEAVAGEILDHASDDVTVAYRRGRRLVPEFRRAAPRNRLEWATDSIRDNGTYLITGGLGSMGLAFAEWIASRARANLVLAARHSPAGADDAVPLDPGPPHVLDPVVAQAFDRLCGRLILEYFTAAGVDLRAGTRVEETAIAGTLEVVPRYRKMLDWCLRVLEEDGVIEQRAGLVRGRWNGDGASAAELAAHLRTAAGSMTGLVDLLVHCSGRYRDVLSGRVEGTEVLYPDGTPAFLEAGFEQAASYSSDRVYLDALGRHVARLAERTPGRQLRIIEVGGGTGTLTDTVYRELQGRPVEFTFTDVSQAFVSAAEAEAKRRGLRGISFRRLDVSRRPLDQGCPERAFDVVLGYNVVHATSDVREALRNLGRLLVPGGHLCLVETVKTARWDQMIWGLATGWWEYADDVRAGSPLLDLDRWETVCADAGFDRIATAPREAGFRTLTDAGLIVARAPDTTVADRAAAERIAAIEATGSRVLVARVDVGDADEMRRLAADVRARYGRITGVIHTAGVIGRGFIRQKTVEAARRVLAPKLRGVRALEAALGSDAPDFFIMCSGLASRYPVAGQADYAAANAALDGFAHEYRQKTRARVTSIGWGFWQELGMIEKSAMSKAEQSRIAEEIVANGWTTAGVEAFETILFGCDGPETLVYPHDLPGAADAQSSPAAVRRPRHPLLLERVEQEGWTAYRVGFSEDTQWVLDEHRLGGRATLPGTAYLELMRAAYADRRGDAAAPLVLRDVLFLQPYVAEPDHATDLRVVLRNRSGRTDAFVISGDDDRCRLHARAEISDLPGAGESSPIPRPPIAAADAPANAGVPAELSVRLSGFGPRWDNVSDVRVDGNAAAARLRLPAPFERETGRFGLHPALLDNATGFLSLYRQTTARVPFSYQSVTVRAPVSGTVVSYATAHGAAGSADESFDVVLTDERGRTLVEITGYRFRALAAIEPDPGHESRDAELRLGTRGSLDTLSFATSSRRAPAADEVEIRVEASGLNFIEVLYGLGMLPDRLDRPFPFGLEGAGVVERVGADVASIRCGDAVAVFANGTARLFATVPARAVALMPKPLGFEEAATIPAAYMTAYTALVEQGRLQRGERVLIHSACGGVGLAAVHVARWVGARILATAGTPEKRAHLRQLGIETVMDSRARAFGAETMTATDGLGVDVVLNSLSGDLLEVGLSVLAPGGRFLELGKRDILAGTTVSLSHFQRRLSFIAIDVGPDLPQFDRLWREVWTRVAAGDFPALPSRVVPAADAAVAFAEMARGRHIGKFVLSFGDRQAIDRQARQHGVAPRAAGGHQPLAAILALVEPTRQPEPPVAAATSAPREGAPEGAVEQAIATIWEDLLGTSPVGRHDDFFVLNGDSLVGAQVMARMQQVLGVRIPLSAIFDHSTVASLAALVARTERPAGSPAVVAGVDHGLEEGVI